MVDPLSITVGVSTLMKICGTVSWQLKQFHGAVKVVDATVDALISDLDSLSRVLEALNDTAKATRSTSLQETGHIGTHWRNLSVSVTSGEDVVQHLHILLERIGKESSYLSKPRMQLRFYLAADELARWQQRLQSCRDTIQLSLTTIVLWYQVAGNPPHADVLPNLDGINVEIKRLARLLTDRIQSAQELELPADKELDVRLNTSLRDCVRSAATVVSSASTVLGVNLPERQRSLIARSTLDDCFPHEPSFAMLRWLDTVTERDYQMQEEMQSNTLKDPSSKGSRSSSESESETEIEAELISSLLKRGTAAFLDDQLDLATQALHKCLVRLEKFQRRCRGRPNSSLYTLQRTTLQLLLRIAIQQYRWDDAQGHTLKSLALRKKVDSSGDVNDLEILIWIQLRKGDLTEAHRYARQMWKAFRKMADCETKVASIVSTLRLLAAISLQQGNVDEEEAYSAKLADLGEDAVRAAGLLLPGPSSSMDRPAVLDTLPAVSYEESTTTFSFPSIGKRRTALAPDERGLGHGSQQALQTDPANEAVPLSQISLYPDLPNEPVPYGQQPTADCPPEPMRHEEHVLEPPLKLGPIQPSPSEPVGQDESSPNPTLTNQDAVYMSAIRDCDAAPQGPHSVAVSPVLRSDLAIDSTPCARYVAYDQSHAQPTFDAIIDLQEDEDSRSLIDHEYEALARPTPDETLLSPMDHQHGSNEPSNTHDGLVQGRQLANRLHPVNTLGTAARERGGAALLGDTGVQPTKQDTVLFDAHARLAHFLASARSLMPDDWEQRSAVPPKSDEHEPALIVEAHLVLEQCAGSSSLEANMPDASAKPNDNPSALPMLLTPELEAIEWDGVPRPLPTISPLQDTDTYMPWLRAWRDAWARKCETGARIDDLRVALHHRSGIGKQHVGGLRDENAPTSETVRYKPVENVRLGRGYAAAVSYSTNKGRSIPQLLMSNISTTSQTPLDVKERSRSNSRTESHCSAAPADSTASSTGYPASPVTVFTSPSIGFGDTEGCAASEDEEHAKFMAIASRSAEHPAPWDPLWRPNLSTRTPQSRSFI